MSGNDCWNRVCFSCCWKADNELADVTLSGSLFQNFAADTCTQSIQHIPVLHCYVQSSILYCPSSTRLSNMLPSPCVSCFRYLSRSLQRLASETLLRQNNMVNFAVPIHTQSVPSVRQHPSYGDCQEVNREYYQNSSVLDCVTQCSQSAAHLYEQFLQVQQIGFVTLGPLRCA